MRPHSRLKLRQMRFLAACLARAAGARARQRVHQGSTSREKEQGWAGITAASRMRPVPARWPPRSGWACSLHPVSPRGTRPGGPAPAAPPAPPPCAAAVKACVSISRHTAWLSDGRGHTLDGPVQVTTGGPGQATPGRAVRGAVERPQLPQQRLSRRAEPYSVFFDTHGRAFHEGSLGRRSGGCVHLSHDDAARFFQNLNPNDRVQILP